MDLSIAVFDLRDAIEELREERAEMLKRIEALEAEKPANTKQHSGDNNHKLNPRKGIQPAPNPVESEERRNEYNAENNSDDPTLEDGREKCIHAGILPEGESR